jgi:hypothetical protein
MHSELRWLSLNLEDGEWLKFSAVYEQTLIATLVIAIAMQIRDRYNTAIQTLDLRQTFRYEGKWISHSN